MSQLRPPRPSSHYLQRRQICFKYLVSLHEYRGGFGVGFERQWGGQTETEWTQSSVNNKMCDKGCGLVFTTEFGLPQLAGQFTFMWQVFLRKSHMRAKILNDRLLIFCFAAITLFLPPCPMCTFPLSSLYKATKAHTHTHRTWGKKSTPLLLCILSVCCSGRGFGWSALIAMGLSLSLVLCSKKKNKKTESSHSSNQHLPDSSPRELPQVFFLIFFPFVFFLTNNCDVPNSQKGAVICFLSAIFNSKLNTL